MSKYTKINFKVPDVNRSFAQGDYKFSNTSVIQQNNGLLDKVKKSLIGYINTWGTEFEVDNSLIATFIATESGATNAPPNKYDATGLMQITPPTVWEVLAKWEVMVKSPLSDKAKSFFNKAIPSSKSFNLNVKPTTGQLSEIRKALQNNSEFNIAIGTATIRWLLEAFQENGSVHINKVMVTYNSSYYGYKNKLKGSPTTEQLVNNKGLPLESRAYLLKMLGVNGFLDLWFKKQL